MNVPPCPNLSKLTVLSKSETLKKNPCKPMVCKDFKLWLGTELNRRHKDFQTSVPPYISALIGVTARLVPMRKYF